MRRFPLGRSTFGWVLLALTATVLSASAQDVPTMSRDQILAYTKVQLAIGVARDTVQAQLAMTANKKDEVQEHLQQRLTLEIDSILKANGMTENEYKRQTFIVSADPASRQLFDSLVVALTGAPIPGQVAAAAGGRGAGAAAEVALPAGALGLHIGHVIRSFTGTPNNAGLLPTAIAETRIATQHAGLAARDPANLDNMKLHAGHVLHAIDPTIETSGPGQGYGAKKAAATAALHIEMASKSEGATASMIMHATHVATSARNTVRRAEQIVELAQKVKAATDAAVAADLVSQMVSLTQQLTAGADANGDGRITWEDGEGGLQHCEEHVALMLRG